MTRITRSTTVARAAKLLELCKQSTPIEKISTNLGVNQATVKRYLNEGVLTGYPELEKLYGVNKNRKKKKLIPEKLLKELGERHGVRV